MIGAAGPAEFSRHEFCLRQRHIFYKSSHNWSSACSSAPMTGQRVFFSRLTWCHELGPSWVPQRYFQFRSFRLFILSDAIHQILGIRELKPNSSQPKGSPPRLNTCATGIRVWMFSLLTFGHLRIPQMCQQKLLGSGWRNRQTSRNDLYNTLPFVPNFLDLFGKSSIPLIAMVDTVWLEELWQHQHLSCPFVAGSC